MRKNSAKITLPAMMSAITVVLMYVSSLFPTGKMGFLGIASLLGVAAVIELGLKGGFAVYAISSVLGFLLVPMKDVVFMYAVFFGYYPMLKSFAEKSGKTIFGWGVKLAAVNIVLTVLVMGFSEMFYDFSGLNQAKPMIYLIVNAVFVLFDIGVTGVIGFYMDKIYRKIRR